MERSVVVKVLELGYWTRTRETQFTFTTMELYQRTLGLFPSIQATCVVLGKTEGEPTMHAVLSS